MRELLEKAAQKGAVAEQGGDVEIDAVTMIQDLAENDYRDAAGHAEMIERLRTLIALEGEDDLARDFLDAVSDACTDIATALFDEGEEGDEGDEEDEYEEGDEEGEEE